MKYRKKQDQIVGVAGRYKEKIATADLIIKQLLSQIDQIKSFLEGQNRENEDVQVKIVT